MITMMMMLTTAFLHDKSYDHDHNDDDKVIDANNVDKNHELHSREVVRPSLKSNLFKLQPGDYYRETRGTNINTNIFLFYLKVHN